ncbi:MAG TPA: hypothetical protein VGR90_01735, partial [Acidimicrobiales bacterium]|nr:hypothetical protein [Acidimicrobiales bacterium]
MPRRTPTQLPSRLLGAFGRPALRAVAACPARNGGLLGLGGAVLSGVLLTALGGPAVGASTPGGTMPAAASQASAPPVPDYVRAAEAEVGPFVAAFESYSYADAPRDLARRVAPFVTPQLQSLLAAPSQGGAGAALAAEKASATASAGTMYVESASPTRVVLLVTADIAVTSTTGNSTLERYVPLTVVQSSGGWLISDVDSLIETA